MKKRKPIMFYDNERTIALRSELAAGGIVVRCHEYSEAGLRWPNFYTIRRADARRKWVAELLKQCGVEIPE